MIEIREYQPNDLDSVYRIWEQVYTPTKPHHAPAISIGKKLEAGDHLFFVATDGGNEVIGTIMGGYDGHRGWVYSLAVDPAHQRRGVGSDLIKHLEEEYRRRGCLKINLQVIQSNESVVSFYEKLGYTLEPRISMAKLLYDPETDTL